MSVSLFGVATKLCLLIILILTMIGLREPDASLCYDTQWAESLCWERFLWSGFTKPEKRDQSCFVDLACELSGNFITKALYSSLLQ